MHPKPKKKLGQNFLVDKNIQKKIIGACAFRESDTVLEIGPGRGELTEYLVRTVSFVYAVEIDPQLSNILKEGLNHFSNLKIINKDILKFNPEECLADTAGRIKIIGNIPYYISSPVIERLLNFRDIIETVFVTLQKEYAERLTASCGTKDYGSFSCFVQYYAAPKVLFTIKKNSFFPVPKVDSCFVRMDIRQRPLCEVKDEKFFFRVIRASFNKRRKTLRNSLTGIISKEGLGAFFGEYEINANIRPEDLALADFANLANMAIEYDKRQGMGKILR